MHVAIKSVRNSSIFLTFVGIGLLFFCGQVIIPIKPVPINLQTVAILAIGLTFTKTDALRSIVGYLALGATGFPIFSEFSGGFSRLLGPNGGYLFGFLAAIWIMCSMRERLERTGPKEMILIALVGNAVIYVVGVPWLSAFNGLDFAITEGFFPFIIPEIAKSLLVAYAISMSKELPHKEMSYALQRRF